LPQNLRRFVHKNAAITKTITDMYIHERENWTQFRWDESKISLLLEIASRKQGLLYGRLGDVGFDSKLRAMAENLTMDVVHSSEIEGIKLNIDEVRSSIARKLGIENVKYIAPSHYVDSVVSVMLEAIKNYNKPLTKQRLCAWQAAFFPSGYSEGSEIEVVDIAPTRSISFPACLDVSAYITLHHRPTELMQKWLNLLIGSMPI
jgi:hypothetical protein